MLCSVIKGPTFDQARQQLSHSIKYCSLAELRIDFFERMDLEQIKSLKREFSIPMIFTLRPHSQGGNYLGSEEDRIHDLMKLALLKPEYFDMEYTLPAQVISDLKSISPETKIIVSYHDFEKMSPPKEALQAMQKHNADIYKMAFMIHSSADALSLLLFMKDHAPHVLAMGMGPYGESTRILGPLFGACFVYGSVDQDASTAPGQIPVDVLSRIYHFKNLSRTSEIHGLIGDPVSKSLSHLSHNAAMSDLKLDMVYNKFQVPPENLAEFIILARKARIRGLSVTMPLKEKIIPLIDVIDPWAKKIGAVNTLKFENGKIIGYNTDGKGALDSIEEKMKVRGKKIVFIGAGGAAKAVIAEAIERGARVTILNRDENKALDLAEKMCCKGGSLEQMAEVYNEGYDILVNTTPSPMPIDSRWILPNTIVMDIKTQPQYTELLKEAKLKGCTLVYGYEMFVNQAVEQYRIWFGDKIDLNIAKKTIEETVLKHIQKD